MLEICKISNKIPLKYVPAKEEKERKYFMSIFNQARVFCILQIKEKQICQKLLWKILILFPVLTVSLIHKICLKLCWVY